MIERIATAWRHWKTRRLLRDHARYTADAINLIGETNPTLASVTFRRVMDAMGDTSPDDWEEFSRRLTLVIDITQDAARTEYRRLYGQELDA